MKKFLLFFLISFFCKNALAQINFTDPNFSFTIVSDGWVQPMGAAYTADAQQLFVWEKRGNLFVCNKNGNTYTRQETPVINLTDEILNYSDFGLIGVALDPNYLSNGFVYLLYVVDRRFLMNDNSITADAGTGATIGRVTRYKTVLNGGQLLVDPTSRTILLGETQSTGIPILHDSHGVGSLVFAADGTLLLSAGDAATYNGADNGNDASTFFAQALSDGIIREAENVGAFRAQLLNSHNGKLLRIDPATGNGVTSNPFYDGSAPRSPKSRIWALGFRNPFRFIVRPGTGSTNPLTGDIGEILIGDVGWEDWEEINIVTGPGMNFGWPVYDGLEVNPEYAADAASTENIDEPNPLAGTGGCSRSFFTFGELLKQPTADANMTLFSPCDPSVVIGTGNRYVHKRPTLDFAHTVSNSRVGIFSGNSPAVATIGTPESGVNGDPFMGSCVVAGMWYTGDNFPPQYRDKFFIADWTNSWVKQLSIDYTDVVTKVDNFATDFKWVISMVQNPVDGTVCVVNMDFPPVGILEYGGNQPPVAKPVATGSLYGISPLPINFAGSTSFDPSPGGGIISYAWDFDGGTPATSNVANPGNVVFTAPAGIAKKFVVKLTVTDNGADGGATHTDSIIVSVNNTPPVVHITSPANSTYVPGPPANYTCTASVSDAEHNGPGELTYEWQTFLRHNTHQHAGPIDNNEATTTKIDRIGCNGDTYYWLIHLKVTDAAGLSTADSVKLFPDCNVGPDILPPTVLSVDPVNGTTEIDTGTPITANFNESIDPATVTETTFQLKDAGNNVVAAGINVNPLSNQIILTPSAPLTNSAVYTVTITSGAGGVKDLSGNALAIDYIWSFTTVAADNVPPTVTSVLPLNGATEVAINATATVNFNEPIDASTATVTTVQLKDEGNNIIPADITISANQIVVAPSAALTNSMTYTVTIASGALGVKDLAGNALASDYSWSFTTAAAGATTNILPPAEVPDVPLSNDGTGGIALGVKFKSTQNGFITGVRYYKGAGTTGVHIGQLWTAAGVNLAQATFTNETASGWQQVLFSNPVAITAGVTYVASYYSPSGDYAATENYFTQAVINGPLRGLADGEDGINGLYKYTAMPEIPNGGYLASNYWADVVFTTTVDVTPPAISTLLPLNGSAGISTTTTVSANFNEAIDATTVNGTTFQLKDAADNLIAASITVNANQILLTPSASLPAFGVYTATIKSGTLGVKDLAGNAISSDIIWSFTTGATLPILLHKFSVSQNGAVNLVKWTTELELDMEYFELERSTNGVNFEPINRQPASNTPGHSSYSYADNNFSPGLTYYRLKMVEYGAIIKYSIIIKVVTGGENNELKVLPNPVTGNFYLSYYSLKEEKVTLEINDVAGRVVHTVQENVNKGQNIIHIQDKPGWHAGVYSVVVKNTNGTKQVKFVKVQ